MKIQFRFSDTGRVWEPRLLCISGALTPRRLLGWAVVLTGLVMLCVVMSGAHAQGVPLSDQSVGIFDNILEQYMKKAVTWEDGLRRIALSLFGGLATISLAWTFIKIMLQKNEATAFIPTITLQIFTLGFFLYLVEKGTWIARLIITSFTAAGERVGNTDSALTPSWVAINGMDCVFRIVEKAADLGLTEQVSLGLPLLLCGLLLCFAFVGVAILLLVTLIESYFVLYGGVILLGFGALPWTREIPKNYLIYAINVGVKLFVLSLVIGVGVQYSSDWPAMIANSEVGDLLPNVIYLLSGAAVFVAVAWKVPGIAAAISSGALNFNASDVLGTGAAAAGIGAAAGAVATGGLSTLGAAATGALQAATAGTSLAAQQGASGLGAALKGLGHAGSAAFSEAGAAAKARVGFAPPSPAATDGRGRPISNLGTRAANNLHQQAQAVAEAKAAQPVPPAQGAENEPPATSPAGPTGQADSSAGTPAAPAGPAAPATAAAAPSATAAAPVTTPPSGSLSAPAPSAASSSAAGSAAPPARGAAASSGPSVFPPTGASTAGGGGASGSAGAGTGTTRKGAAPFADVYQDSRAGSRLAPPTLPPDDAAAGGVTINLQTSDE